MKDKWNLGPKDHREAVALFRAEVIGALARRDLSRGELARELDALSEKRFRMPGSKTTRHFSVPTLERWLYTYKKGGLEALMPKRRSDEGHARDLPESLVALLLDIRREHPRASVPVIRRTLIADGRLDKNAVSNSTLRRLYKDHGLGGRTRNNDGEGKLRLRWQAERPYALWHADVCHMGPILVGGTRMPVRIHGMLDDASRYVPALEARHTELELDMLLLLVSALRKHGACTSLYLDNGSCYRGEILQTACTRLGISLLHAKPYDPKARAKMERFWLTLRRGCLDFIGEASSLHDINVRMYAFLDQHYHRAPHAGLLGRTPKSVFNEAKATRPPDGLDEKKLRDALTVHVRRRVRRDSTLSIEGQEYELAVGHLTGTIVEVAYCPIDAPPRPWVEHQGKILPLHPVDPVLNGKMSRRPKRHTEAKKRSVAFDPARALLDRAAGRHRAKED
jgi:putative transposase